MNKAPDLAPIPNAGWPEEIVDMLSGFAGKLNVYRAMAHHPALLRAWTDLRDHVVNKTALGPELSEVVILRTGVRLGSDYEWNQHVVRSRSRGLDDQRIASLRGAPDDMAPPDAALARAVDELFDSAKLSTQSLAEVAGLVGKEGVIDLIATVGFYSTLGFLLNTARTPLDEDVRAELSNRPLSQSE